MPGKIVIRQLWDEEKERTPTLKDIDKSQLTNKKTWKCSGKTYTTYENKEGEKPYENRDKVTWKNLTKYHGYRLPAKFVKEGSSRKRVVNRPRLLHELFRLQKKFENLGGKGYYNIYIIGGRNPPIQYILQRWITRS